MTITLKLPEEIAAILRTVPVRERGAYAIAALRRVTESLPLPHFDADFEESCAAIARSAAQIENGETVSLEECIARSVAKRNRLLGEPSAVAQ